MSDSRTDARRFNTPQHQALPKRPLKHSTERFAVIHYGPSEFLLISPPVGSPPFIIACQRPLTTVDTTWAKSGGIDVQAYFRDLNVMESKVEGWLKTSESRVSRDTGRYKKEDWGPIETVEIVDLTLSDDDGCENQLDFRCQVKQRSGNPPKRKHSSALELHQGTTSNSFTQQQNRLANMSDSFRTRSTNSGNTGWTPGQEKALWEAQVGRRIRLDI